MSTDEEIGRAEYWCELAWLGGEAAEAGVHITIEAGRFSQVMPGVDQPPTGVQRLTGLTLPGFANAHSHAFHRALRGRSHREAGGAPGTFWTWRQRMYEVAERLDPDTYFRLARATFAEMALAGITAVGEFHYLHHGMGGRHYSEPNAMGSALLAAAHEAGLRITLLDTCYLHGGLAADGYQALAPAQLRFSDGSAEAWAERAGGLAVGAEARVGAAIHSVRAVDPSSMATVAAWARERACPLHAHVSEQPAENEASLLAHGRTPVALLDEAGALGERFTAVHATHLSKTDIGLLGALRCTCCFCPTTERDLADGIGPASQLRNAGARLALGSDSHAVIDPLEEARAMELDERLATNQRGSHSPRDLLIAATASSHRAIGEASAGAIIVGARADLVTVALDGVRTAGASDPASALDGVLFAASAADVRDVIRDGRPVVRDGAHLRLDVAAELRDSIAAVT